ncbi:MAG TPA: purine-nucleoside phosphorylase [Actinomycetota bacterium]|nr:purine-nucleoside phosphorylase [Actinomycetota bacterium]
MSIADLTGRADYRVAIVLGSGLGSVAERLTGATAIPYSDIEGWPRPRVPGHEGALYAGEIEGVPSLVLAGRVHLYEGHAPAAVAHAVLAAVDAGCEVVVLTNAAGGINTSLSVGELVLISDHLNLTGSNPLIGGASFLDMTEVYDAGLRVLAGAVSPGIREGVYAGVIGPVYETPAEIRMLATLGADLVGMSTVHEAIAARSRGARVLGLSLVTNAAAGLGAALDHEEVRRAGVEGAGRVEALLRGVVAAL